MPRQKRFRLPDIPQHVIARGNNRKPCFFHPSDYRRYLALLHESSVKYRCQIHAYVLMTNHVHLLMTPETSDGISRTMQAVGRRYVQQVNARYGRTGTLWEGRFKATVVDSEEYVLACYRYIELNPVRSGMVTDSADYLWSSYACNALGRTDRLVTGHHAYLDLGSTSGSRRAAYRELFGDQMTEEQLDRIRSSARMAQPLGNDRFKADIEAALRRRIPRNSWGGARPGAGRKSAAAD